MIKEAGGSTVAVPDGMRSESIIYEELKNAREIFKAHVSMQPSSSRSIIYAWHAYFNFAALREELYGKPKEIPSHTIELVKSLRGIIHDPEQSRTGKSIFKLSTIGPGNGRVGELLTGLEGEDLKNSFRFCQSMLDIDFSGKKTIPSPSGKRRNGAI